MPHADRGETRGTAPPTTAPTTRQQCSVCDIQMPQTLRDLRPARLRHTCEWIRALHPAVIAQAINNKILITWITGEVTHRYTAASTSRRGKERAMGYSQHDVREGRSSRDRERTARACTSELRAHLDECGVHVTYSILRDGSLRDALTVAGTQVIE